MSSATVIVNPAEALLRHRKRWTGDEYERLVDMGAFEREHVELIEGELATRSPMNDKHAFAIRLAQFVLGRVFPPDQFTITIQTPMRLADNSRPEPDLLVVRGTAREISTHPTTGLLLVEVSGDSLEFDRKVKAPLYARHGIAEYWIVNLNDDVLEVRRDPTRHTSAGVEYGDVRMLKSGESITPIAASDHTIAIDDLLPV